MRKLRIHKYGMDGPDFYTPQRSWPSKTKFIAENHMNVSPQGYVFNFKFTALVNDYRFDNAGDTLEQAEEVAFLEYQKKKDKLCKYDHSDSANCERRDYENGVGFCLYCGKCVAYAFDPILHPCRNCRKPCHWSSDIEDQPWCKKCSKKMPLELMRPWQKRRHEEEVAIQKIKHQEKLAKRRRKYRLKKIGPGVDVIKQKLSKFIHSK